MRTERRSSTKVCGKCHIEKPKTEFYPAPPSRRSDVRAYCKECSSGRDRAAEYARSGRARDLRERYGITPEEYKKMLKEQDGLCAVCREICSTGMRLSVDHDHESGEVRGLLCKQCNLAAGNLRDDPANALRLSKYLERR